ncbi:MAG: sigma 54-interacting transcriptional regulator [Candidatus Cloacimonetes bacterium]|nr:sigma 54-interacting transcriptional regulator [Candidatus Cloacimonadota bacterium]
MNYNLEERTFRELEQLTEADPLQFMQRYAEFDKQPLNENDRQQLLYLRARALVTMNQTAEAEELTLSLLSTAVQQGNHLLSAQCNLVLSKCNNPKDSPDKQKQLLDIAYGAAKQSQNNRMIVECLIHLGALYQTNNDRTNALKCHSKADRLCDDLQDSDIILQVKIALGNTYYHFAEHHKALVVLSDAFRLSLECGDVNRQILIINNLSTLFSMLKRFTEAEEILQKGIQISSTHNIPMRKVLLLFNLGVLLMRRETYQRALEKLLECMQFAETIGFDNPKYQIELYNNIAGCYRYLSEPETAKQYIQKAEDMARQMHLNPLVKEIELNKANLLLSMGSFKEAKKLLLDVKKYFIKHKKYELLIHTNHDLADCYEQQQEYHRSIKVLREVDTIYKEYMAQVMSLRANEYETQLQNLLKKFDEVKDNYNKLAYRFSDRILGDFIGKSPQHQNVLSTAMMAAQHPTANVLITGESGTGKDVIANLIHMNSSRSDGPFVAVNVSAITASLIESEFFGHCKGSFTGAVSDHKGFFLRANHGTLFLDEIGDMPNSLQSKLLRVLESRKVTPVGTTIEVPFDCRIISSTNCDLDTMLANNQFRLDLFHRLNTLEINIPALRSHPEDIPVLIDYFAELLAKQNNRKSPLITSSFVIPMVQYPFPGNVRELKNMIERLFILCPSDRWDESVLKYLPLDDKLKGKANLPISQVTQQTEKEMIIKALQVCDGKQKDAAKSLNMSESTLTRRIYKYKLEVYTRKGN